MKYKNTAERKAAKRAADARYRARVKAAKQLAAQPTPKKKPAPRINNPLGTTAAVPQQRRTNIAIVCDHSSSMSGIRDNARQDYNNVINSIKNQGSEHSALVTRVECGVRSNGGGWGSVSRVAFENVSTHQLTEMGPGSYETKGGSTPLYDAIGLAIQTLLNSPGANSPDVSFLVQVVTDGEENSSTQWDATALSRKIAELQGTDRWTFTFRVPRGHANQLSQKLGVALGNFYEWETTARGMATSSVATSQALGSYFTQRSAGQTRTLSFYADLSNVDASQVKAACKDISTDISIWPVAETEHGKEIRDFIESRLKGRTMVKGTAFYELNKPERNVQSYKKIVIRDKKSNAVYGGQAARQLLNLPTNVDIKLAPGNHGNYDIFIQSTSVNRKVQKGTQVVYWENAV